jgi:hypothetical protein
MTTAYERTKAVIETRQFLQMLASADEVTIRGLVQSVAVCTHSPSTSRCPPQHYPESGPSPNASEVTEQQSRSKPTHHL